MVIAVANLRIAHSHRPIAGGAFSALQVDWAADAAAMQRYSLAFTSDLSGSAHC